MIVVAVWAAFLLRLGYPPSPFKFFSGTALLVTVRLLFLWRYNLLRGWWRYTGFNEVMDLAKATGLGTLVFFFAHKFAAGFFFGQRAQWPGSVYLIETVMTAIFLGMGRAASRFLADLANRPSSKSKRLILIGAGDSARRIMQELRTRESGYQIVGCVDDDVTKYGISFEGVRVEGTTGDLSEIANRLTADEIWISTPSATASQMNRLIRVCTESNLPFKSLPRLRDIVTGNIVPQVREVRTTDLLGRDPVIPDLLRVREKIQGKRVMVTGAAGSIGSELCRQLADYGPAELICLDQSETGIFYLEHSLRDRAKKVPVRYCVADIANVARMQRIMTEHRVEIIFHAAAYKHVPVMEANVSEAVFNNVTALKSLLDTADACNVHSFVMISSDKAVNPTNVMGTTKRIGELIIASRPRTKMECVAVRFGNVLGSNGSVVPLFQEQIRRDNEITITHPNIKRFFMTIDEAVSLVLQAFTVGEHGDILVLDMGEPIRIVDLAKNLIRLSGKTEEEVKIRYVGLREGEKLKEELFYESEEVWPTACNKVMRTKSAVRSWSELSRKLKQLDHMVETDSAEDLKMIMQMIVPEFEPLVLGHRSPGPQEIRSTRAAAGGSSSIQ